MDIDIKVPNAQRCEEVFNELDIDKSNYLEPVEFPAAFQRLGLKVQTDEIKAIMAIVDANDDGKLSLKEFMHLVYVCQNRVENDMKRLLFLVTDKDFSRTIDENEMFVIFKRLGTELTRGRISQIFREYSDQADGTMGYKAYRTVLSTLLE